MKRIAVELVELRALLFSVYRDPKKSSVITARDLAPDLFPSGAEAEDLGQEQLDMFADSVLKDVSFGN